MWTSGRMSNAKNLLGLGVSLYFWGLMDLTTTVLSGSARPLIEGQEDNLSDKLHQRMKRSWVWNQFFVLEEYTGTDPLYVGKVRPAPEGYLAGYIHLCICRPRWNMGSFSKCLHLLSGSEFIHTNFISGPKSFDQCHLHLRRISVSRGCQYICLFQRDLLLQSSSVIELVLENLQWSFQGLLQCQGKVRLYWHMRIRKERKSLWSCFCLWSSQLEAEIHNQIK